MSHRSRMCALLIDCPEDRIETSLPFWSAALGRPVKAKINPNSPYSSLETPEGSTLDLFVQMTKSQESRLHFDIETDDVEAEVRRLERLGARRKQHMESWWVMEAPSDHIFCVVPVQSKVWPVGAIDWLE